MTYQKEYIEYLRSIGKLEMSAEEIRKAIVLKNKNWHNIKSTNCYAFALGLDIDEEDIAPDAYQLGIMSYFINNYPNSTEWWEKSLSELLLMDLDTLRIYHCEVDPKEVVPDDCWKIAYMEADYDFHFARQAKNGIWYHKQGFLTPTCYDDSGSVITDICQADIEDYQLKKVMCLSLRNINKKNKHKH